MRSQPSRFESEEGIYFIMIAACMFALLALIGLAIDSSLLFTSKRKVQNAIDAAVISSAKQIVRGATQAEAEARAKALFYHNLAHMSISAAERQRISANSELSINISNEGRNIEGYANILQPTWIMSILPGFADSNRVYAASQAINMELQVVLVVDESTSMSQSLPQPPAGCANKNCAARYAVGEFIKLLLPFDKVAIVGFSSDYVADNGLSDDLQKFANDARQIIGLSTAGDPSDRILPGNAGRFGPAVNQIELRGNTNIGAGLRLGREILNSTPTAPHLIKAIVLLTDGAPFWEFNSSQGPEPLSSVEDPSRPWYTDCTDARREELTLAFQRGQQLLFNSSSVVERQSEVLRRRRFLDAIHEADATLDQGIFIYAVGLGELDNSTLTPDTSSPFQDGRWSSAMPNSDLIKQFLLNRLSNDQSKMRVPGALPSPVPDPVSPYYWDFPCVRSGAMMSNKPRGQSFFTPTGESLTATFVDLGGRIRTRLSN